MRVLLIEPDTILANIYISALSQAEHIVTWKTDAQEAIQDIDKQLPDLILLEIQLARHNGLEFLYELRSYLEWESIPVVILTGVPDFSLNPLLLQLGVKACHYKPQTSLKKLLKTVQLALPA